MSYTLCYAFGAVPGLILQRQFLDADGVPIGSPVSGETVEVDDGWYLAKVSVPTDHRGGLKFWPVAGGTTVALFGVNPEEGEEMRQIHGLLGRHQRTANAVYVGADLISYEVRTFATAAEAIADDGTAGAMGLLNRYQVVNTYAVNGNFLTSTMTLMP